MHFMQVFLAAILMAVLSLASANDNISDRAMVSILIPNGPSTTVYDSSIASTLTLGPSTSDCITTSTASVTASTTASIILNPTPFANPNDTQSCSPCYCEGETWDELGTWQAISWALQNSGIVRVTYIPGGYHVNENIRVGDHCFVYEIGVNTGNSGDMSPASITNLLSAAHTDCLHGGRWNLNFVAGDGDIIGRGWLKADPQKNSDCS